MKTLCLHASHFPYGHGEPFIETEIKYLANAFEKIVIIPNNPKTNKRGVPKNVEILKPDYSGYSTLKGIKNIGSWFFSCLPDALKSKNKILAISTLLRAGYQAEMLYYFLKNNNLINNTIHYTYWFNEQSTMLSILKSKKRINGYISRAHGFDLYEERNKEGRIPFRKFQLKHVSKLFLISKNGLEYMQHKYPQYQSKYELSYLGIENNYPFTFKEPEESKYTLVSCSRLVDIKRVDLILKALSQITNIPIRWIHFGDGPLFDEVKTTADDILPGNVEADFKGQVKNTEIYHFYQNNHVDCFINLSSSEGLPVSIMEATSYGIPVIATDVGGTNEIVNSKTGILLSSEPNLSQIAKEISKFLQTKSRNKIIRTEVYKYWNEYFNAELNYSAFTETIKNIDI